MTVGRHANRSIRGRRGRAPAVALVLGLGALAGSAGAAPAAGRGAMLYENHCRECHTSEVHIRERRLGHDEQEVRRLIRRWAANLRLQWTVEEVDDVFAYLNRRHYRFESAD